MDAVTYSGSPFETRWDGDGPHPTMRMDGVDDIPHLVKTHPRRWPEVLAPVNRDRLAGLKPTQLARLLVRTGVRNMQAQHR